ncbi:MAG: hypothetical protein LBN42_00730 [Oscillospiraceae bacterium]|jgi:hypothetical protein|nr:hypothetical protein [Oscillospiraceae bacterium]
MGDKKYQVELRPAALNKFAEHVAFVSKKSPNAAVQLRVDFKNAVEFILYNPNGFMKYTPVKRRGMGYRLFLFGKGNRYRLIFSVYKDKVIVHDVQDCRQSPNKSLV